VEVYILGRHFHFTPPFTNVVISHKEELCVKGNIVHERNESEVMFLKKRNQQRVTPYKKDPPQTVHSVTQQYTESTKPLFTSRKSYILYGARENVIPFTPKTKTQAFLALLFTKPTNAQQHNVENNSITSRITA